MQCWALICSLFLSVAFCEERPARRYWDPFTFPNPRFKPQQCNILDSGWICDPNAALTPKEREDVNYAAARLRETTSCKCDWNHCDNYDKHGFSAGVAIVDYMDLPEDLSHAEETKRTKDFAYELRRKWNFGQCDDDLVIFVSKGDRKIWTSVGPITRKYLTDTKVSDIYRRAQPMFTNGDWGRGLTTMLNSYNIVLNLRGDSGSATSNETDENGGLAGWVIALLVLGIFCIAVFCIFFCVRCGGDSSGGGSSYSTHKPYYDEPYYGPDTVVHVNTDASSPSSPSSGENLPSRNDPDGGGGGGGDF